MFVAYITYYLFDTIRYTDFQNIFSVCGFRSFQIEAMTQSEFSFCRLTFKMSSPSVSQRADDMLNSGSFFSAFQDGVHRESNDCRNALIINLIMNRIENAWNINHYNTMKGCWANQSMRNARKVRTTRPPIDNNNNMNSSDICLNIESAHW